MTDFMVLRRGPRGWELPIPGVGTSHSLSVKDAAICARSFAAHKLGVDPSAVELDIALPLAELARASLADNDVPAMLAHAADGIGRVLADLANGKPCDTTRRYGRFGWLRDGTPAIFL